MDIDNPVLALDFDLACNFRLVHYDNLNARDRARLTGIACGMAFAGEVLKFDDEKDEEYVTV